MSNHEDIINIYRRWMKIKHLSTWALIMLALIFFGGITGCVLTYILWGFVNVKEVELIRYAMIIGIVLLFVIDAIICIASHILSQKVEISFKIDKAGYNELTDSDKRRINGRRITGYVYALFVMIIFAGIIAGGNVLLFRISPYDRSERLEICSQVQECFYEAEEVNFVTKVPHVDYVEIYNTGAEGDIYYTFNIRYELMENKLDSSNFDMYICFDYNEMTAQEMINQLYAYIDRLPEKVFGDEDMSYLEAELAGLEEHIYNAADDIASEEVNCIDKYVNNGNEEVFLSMTVRPNYSASYQEIIVNIEAKTD